MALRMLGKLRKSPLYGTGRLFERFLRPRKHTYAPFEDLPDEILLLILEQLDKGELCQVARLCKRLYPMTIEPLLSGVEVIVGWGQHGPDSVSAPSWTADGMLGLTILRHPGYGRFVTNLRLSRLDWRLDTPEYGSTTHRFIAARARGAFRNVRELTLEFRDETIGISTGTWSCNRESKQLHDYLYSWTARRTRAPPSNLCSDCQKRGFCLYGRQEGINRTLEAIGTFESLEKFTIVEHREATEDTHWDDDMSGDASLARWLDGHHRIQYARLAFDMADALFLGANESLRTLRLEIPNSDKPDPTEFRRHLVQRLPALQIIDLEVRAKKGDDLHKWAKGLYGHPALRRLILSAPKGSAPNGGTSCRMCSCGGAAFSDREELFSAIPALEYFVCWPWRGLQGWKRDEKLPLVGDIAMGICHLQLIMSNCVEYIRSVDDFAWETVFEHELVKDTGPLEPGDYFRTSAEVRAFCD